MKQDFPGSPVDKKTLADAEDTGLISGPGRFHMLPDNGASAPQPSLNTLETVPCNKRSHSHTTAREQHPLSTTRESLCAATMTQCSQK